MFIVACELCNQVVGVRLGTARACIKFVLHRDIIFTSRAAIARQSTYLELNEVLEMHLAKDYALSLTEAAMH